MDPPILGTNTASTLLTQEISTFNTHENPAVIASTSTKSFRPLAILLPKKVISVQEQMTRTEDSGATCDARLGRCGV